MVRSNAWARGFVTGCPQQAGMGEAIAREPRIGIQHRRSIRPPAQAEDALDRLDGGSVVAAATRSQIHRIDRRPLVGTGQGGVIDFLEGQARGFRDAALSQGKHRATDRRGGRIRDQSRCRLEVANQQVGLDEHPPRPVGVRILLQRLLKLANRLDGLVQSHQLHFTEPRKGGKIVWLTREHLPQQFGSLYGACEAIEQVQRLGDVGLRAQRIQCPGPVEQRGDFRAPGPVRPQQRCELHVGARTARRQLDRLAIVPFCLGGFQRGTQRCALDPGIAKLRVERQRLLDQCRRLPTRLLEARDPVAAVRVLGIAQPGPRQHHPGARELRVDTHRAVEMGCRCAGLPCAPGGECVLAGKICQVSFDAARALPAHPCARRGVHADRERPRDFARDLVLDREHVLLVAVEAQRPEAAIGARLDEPRGDAQVAPVPLHAALQNVVDVETRSDIADRRCGLRETERRGTRNHREFGKARELVEDRFGHAEGEHPALLAAVRVREWQHRDRNRRASRSRSWIAGDPAPQHHGQRDCQRHDGEQCQGAAQTVPAPASRGRRRRGRADCRSRVWRRCNGNCRRDRFDRCDTSVSAAADTGDIPRRLRVVAQRVAQQLHPLADRVGADDQPRPDLAHQFIEAEHARRGARQRNQQVEGESRQRDGLRAARDTQLFEVDEQVSDLQLLRRSGRSDADFGHGSRAAMTFSNGRTRLESCAG